MQIELYYSTPLPKPQHVQFANPTLDAKIAAYGHVTPRMLIDAILAGGTKNSWRYCNYSAHDSSSMLAVVDKLEADRAKQPRMVVRAEANLTKSYDPARW